jgi:hypothetical protein
MEFSDDYDSDDIFAGESEDLEEEHPEQIKTTEDEGKITEEQKEEDEEDETPVFKHIYQSHFLYCRF